MDVIRLFCGNDRATILQNTEADIEFCGCQRGCQNTQEKQFSPGI